MAPPHFDSEAGATAVEYALIAGLIAAMIVVVVAALGLSVEDWFGDFNDRFSQCSAGTGC